MVQGGVKDRSHARGWLMVVPHDAAHRSSALGGTLRADAHAAMDYRHHRLAVLRRQLAQLTAQICATPVGSPERDALLIPMEPLMDTVLALADELHC